MNDMSAPPPEDTPDLPATKDAAGDWQRLVADAAFWRQLTADPYQTDVFAVLRWIDGLQPQGAGGRPGPLLGRAARPKFEPIRLGQEPDLAFAASSIAHIAPGSGERPPRLDIYGFGLFGPNGPLPLHLTEYARDRLRRHGDATLVHFANVFHHRAILLFYRAWADAQPSVSLDRADADRFASYIASLAGYGTPAMRKRDGLPDHAKYFAAPHLVRKIRTPDGLRKVLREYLQVPVAVEEFVPHWIEMDRSEQTCLAETCKGALGMGAFLGEYIPDAQYRIRLRFGPMPLARYLDFLPGSEVAERVADWVKNYLGYEFAVDLQIVLKKEEVPLAQIGAAQLGMTGWLGQRPSRDDATDLNYACRLV